MTHDDIIRQARAAFHLDTASPPPLTLRGGNAVDMYQEPEAYDQVLDELNDAYLQKYTFWGLSYLDAQSWRHYLPSLIDYAFRDPDGEIMVVDALLWTLLPPDNYPPRLASLSAEQEAVVIAFLEELALNSEVVTYQVSAQQALEEWWWPNARYRPTSDELTAWRAKPVNDQIVETKNYRLLLPATFAGGLSRRSRTMEHTDACWRGYLCYDVSTEVFINVRPVPHEIQQNAVHQMMGGLTSALSPWHLVEVPGAQHAQRADWLSIMSNPTEPQRTSQLIAVAGDKAILITIRTWPRDDVQIEVDRIIGSFELVGL